MIALLVGLGLSRGADRWAIDGFLEDGAVGMVLFHGGEVICTLKEVLSLTGGIFCANGLAVDALSREALRVVGVSIVQIWMSMQGERVMGSGADGGERRRNRPYLTLWL